MWILRRVEPKTQYFCDIDYHVFSFMEEHDKDYGFVINLYDSPQSIRTLRPTALDFLTGHEEYLHENNALQWLVQEARANDHNNVANAIELVISGVILRSVTLISSGLGNIKNISIISTDRAGFSVNDGGTHQYIALQHWL